MIGARGRTGNGLLKLVAGEIPVAGIRFEAIYQLGVGFDLRIGSPTSIHEFFPQGLIDAVSISRSYYVSIVLLYNNEYRIILRVCCEGPSDVPLDATHNRSILLTQVPPDKRTLSYLAQKGWSCTRKDRAPVLAVAHRQDQFVLRRLAAVVEAVDLLGRVGVK